MREAASPLTELEGAAGPPVRYRSLWGDAAVRFSRNRIALLGLGIVLLFGLAALSAPLIDRHAPDSPDYNSIRASPNSEYWLGTDNLGRDQWSRLLHGARISLSVGFLTQAVALTLGVTVGMVAGLGGRMTDNLVMRTTDVAYAFPDLLLLILLLSVLGSNFAMIFLAIGLVSWPTLARLVRGQVLSLREREFVLAARAAGARPWRVAFTHLLPNVMGPVIVTSIFGIPFAIFAEAALAYIGVGLSPPTASWGTLVDDGYLAVRSYPHLVLFPALAIAVTMVSFTFIGDGLRDALDPHAARGIGSERG